MHAFRNTGIRRTAIAATAAALFMVLSGCVYYDGGYYRGGPRHFDGGHGYGGYHHGYGRGYGYRGGYGDHDRYDRRGYRRHY